MSKDVIECERCGYRWGSDAAGEKVTCSYCGYKTERNVVGEEVFMRGKFLYMDCENIDDMIEATENRLEALRELKESGFEVSEPESLRDDYCFLWKETTDESDS